MALLSVVLAVLLAGCAGDRVSAAPAAIGVDATSSATPQNSVSPSTATSPVAGDDGMSAPANRSGPLSGRDMPRPTVLGRGWHFRVDDGNQEDGYAGNGTPTVQRDPSEVAGLAVPLGCVDRGGLPRPRWALETDYSHASTIGLVIQLRFATASEATMFMSRRDAALAACAAQTARVGPESTGLVQQLRTVAGRLTVSTRTESGDLRDGSAWTEIAGIGSPESDVTLVALHALQGAAVTRRAITGLGSVRQ